MRGLVLFIVLLLPLAYAINEDTCVGTDTFGGDWSGLILDENALNGTDACCGDDSPIGGGCTGVPTQTSCVGLDPCPSDCTSETVCQGFYSMYSYCRSFTSDECPLVDCEVQYDYLDVTGYGLFGQCMPIDFGSTPCTEQQCASGVSGCSYKTSCTGYTETTCSRFGQEECSANGCTWSQDDEITIDDLRDYGSTVDELLCSYKPENEWSWHNASSDAEAFQIYSVNLCYGQSACPADAACGDNVSDGCGGMITCTNNCPDLCLDGDRNNGETKVSQILEGGIESDCGGPNCPVCPTCEDGKLNQDETNVDCGGICGPCASCNDRVLNQNEQYIDCLGVCGDWCQKELLFDASETRVRDDIDESFTIPDYCTSKLRIEWWVSESNFQIYSGGTEVFSRSVRDNNDANGINAFNIPNPNSMRITGSKASGDENTYGFGIFFRGCQ